MGRHKVGKYHTGLAAGNEHDSKVALVVFF